VHESLARTLFCEDVAHLSDVAASREDLTVNSRDYPVLDVTVHARTPVRIQLVAPQWDEEPPRVVLLTADGCPWPVASAGQPPDTAFRSGGVFNHNAHEITGRTYVCMPGSYDYHTHPMHTADVWERYRGKPGMSLTGILLRLSAAWCCDRK